MHVQELMTTPVLSIGPEASLKDVAEIFVERGISGLPVCDVENHVVGVISEGDILYKEHDPSTGRKGGPLAWLIDGNTPAVIKSRALTVREAMTSPALTVTPWSSVSEAARLMTERGINRLPVVRNDELVGHRHPHRPRARVHPIGRGDRARASRRGARAHAVARARYR